MSTAGRITSATLAASRPIAVVTGRLIDVNRNDLIAAANRIDAFCSIFDSEMGSADIAVTTMLLSYWNGHDADEFRRAWGRLNESSSHTKHFRESLENYANKLRACANLYETTQADVHNFAGNLLRRAGR